MRKINIIDIFNPTKLRDWLNELLAQGGTPGPQGDTGPKGDTGVGIKSITSNQEANTVTVTVTLTDDSFQVFTFESGATA